MQAKEKKYNVNISYSWIQTDSNWEADSLSRNQIPDIFLENGTRIDPEIDLFTWLLGAAESTWELLGKKHIRRNAWKRFTKYQSNLKNPPGGTDPSSPPPWGT